MMAPDKLERARQDIQKLRGKGGVKASKFEGLAKSLGRTKHKRGSEPTWVNPKHPDWRPLSIPHHGSKDINKHTGRSILDQLEEDIEKLEEKREDQREAD